MARARENICFGPYYFKTATTLRNSILLGSMITNSEAWVNVTNAELVEMEIIDESLMRKNLGTSATTAKEMLYLELGCEPIRYIIKKRKLIFLQYILKQGSNSLIKQVL